MSGNDKRGKAVRGFVRGILWGSVAAAGGLVIVSQLAGPVAPPAEESAQGAVPPVALSVPQPEHAAPEAPRASADAPVGQEPPAARDAPSLPLTEGAQPRLTLAEGPAVPAPDAAAIATTPPAEPPMQPPSVAPQERLASAGQVSPPVTPAAGDAPQPVTPPVGPGQPGAEQTPPPADLPPPPPLTPEEEALLQPLPPVTPGGAVDPAPADTAPDPTPEPMARPEIPLPEPEPPQTAIRTPTPELGNAAPGVVTGRLPRIGTEAAPPSEGPVLDPVADDSLPPLQRYARPFDNPAQKPLFAILLVDNGQGDVNRAELAALSVPLTVVIDPLSEGAAERAALWRAGGQEVVMAGTGIPQGAGPGDLEQSFQVLAERLPEAVAVIDVDGRAFQNNRPLSTQIVPILAGQGRGLVTFDQGLNAADQVARREKLPAATIFRRIDPENEESPVIRRYLDRAAFKAAQDGRVIVLGTLRPETIAAVLEWSVEGRASGVALAPVSALLTR